MIQILIVVGLSVGSWFLARLARLSFVIVHLRDDRDGTECVKDEHFVCHSRMPLFLCVPMQCSGHLSPKSGLREGIFQTLWDPQLTG